LKILISGATGFLGSHFVDYFSVFNFNVDTIGRSKKNTIIANFENKLKITNSYFLVIHAAGKAHSIPSTEKENSDFFKINVNGTSNFLEGLSKSIPKQFVFISSVSVYGLVEGEDIDETYPLLAEDPYGKSKIEAEKLVNEWCKKHNVICTILRLPLVVGVNPPGNLGAMIQAIKKGYYFNIAGGNSKKTMVLASDISKFIFKAAEVGGIYNLTDGTHPTFNALSKKISSKFKKSIVLNMPLFAAKFFAIFGDLIGDSFPLNSNKLSKITSTLTFNDTKARIAFCWEPTPVLEGLKLQEDA
jgi:nucleoside-diphosphate-sugar epimerase